MDLLPDPAFDVEVAALTRSDRRAAEAVRHAVQVLAQAEGRIGYPWTSAVRGASGLRELRPRSGRSRHRVLYRRHGEAILLLALAPEASADPRGFAQAVGHAQDRADRIHKETT